MTTELDKLIMGGAPATAVGAAQALSSVPLITNSVSALVDGDQKKSDTVSVKPAAKSLSEKSLKAAGGSFLLADTALFLYGGVSKNPNFRNAAIFGVTEGLVGARYGNPTVPKQMEQLDRHLGDYLRQQGITIPKDPTMKNLTKEGGLIDHLEDFIYKYPSQIMNICYAMIGAFFTNEGIGQVSKHKDGGYAQLASGILILGGALGGLLLQEKKFDEKHPAKTLWEKIQEKPLRLTGTMLNLNVLLQFVSVYKEGKNAHIEAKAKGVPANKQYLWRLLAASSFAFGNTMLALSSKGYGGSDKGADPKLLEHVSDLSARVIASQPPEVQNTLLERISGYLATEPNVNMKAADISTMLHKKLAEVVAAFPPLVDAATNWVGRTGNAVGVAPQASL